MRRLTPLEIYNYEDNNVIILEDYLEAKEMTQLHKIPEDESTRLYTAHYQKN